MLEIIEQSNIRIQKALSISGMKQTDLCERTGLSKGTISQYVSGKRIPKRNAIAILSKALGVSPVWLMGFDVPMKPEEKSKRQELKEAIDGLTEQQAVMLLAFIKTMKE